MGGTAEPGVEWSKGRGRGVVESRGYQAWGDGCQEDPVPELRTPTCTFASMGTEGKKQMYC